MEIRRAVPEDAVDIAAINAAAWKEAFKDVVSNEYLNSYDGAPDVRRDDLLHLPSDALQLVACEEDGIIGWLATQPAEEVDMDPASTFEVRACYVSPSHWRKGTARQLMKVLFDELDFERWRDVILWTPDETPRSHAFYESIGFRRDGKLAEIDRDGPVKIVRLWLSTSVIHED